MGRYICDRKGSLHGQRVISLKGEILEGTLCELKTATSAESRSSKTSPVESLDLNVLGVSYAPERSDVIYLPQRSMRTKRFIV
jgi:hypothetical protein